MIIVIKIMLIPLMLRAMLYDSLVPYLGPFTLLLTVFIIAILYICVLAVFSTIVQKLSNEVRNLVRTIKVFKRLNKHRKDILVGKGIITLTVFLLIAQGFYIEG